MDDILDMKTKDPKFKRLKEEVGGNIRLGKNSGKGENSRVGENSGMGENSWLFWK